VASSDLARIQLAWQDSHRNTKHTYERGRQFFLITFKQLRTFTGLVYRNTEASFLSESSGEEMVSEYCIKLKREVDVCHLEVRQIVERIRHDTKNVEDCSSFLFHVIPLTTETIIMSSLRVLK